MKLKTKLYLFQILLTAVLFIFLGTTYYFYEEQYKKDVQSYVKNEVLLHKKAIVSSIKNANLEFKKRKEFFYEIHQMALQIMKNNPNINLKDLQKNLKEEFKLVNTDVELYLIDKTYTIYQTTFSKDLGFNLSAVNEAKYFLDKTTKDGNIYLSDFTSTDSINMEYKLYSYAKLDDNRYLELGFIDKRINNTAISTINENLKSSNKINLFVVLKNEKGFFNYELIKNRNVVDKENFFKNIETFSFENINKNNILDVGLNFKEQISINDNIVTVITPLFDENMYNIFGGENIVMKLQIDISDKKEFLKNFETTINFSLTIISILLLVLYLFIKRHFTNPIDTISNSLKNSQKINDKTILLGNDELSDISNKYNILFDKLSKEIELNQNLLNENKRFIADTVHQIRTPLTNIMMNGEMVKRFQKDNTLSSFIDKIDSSVNMLSNSYEDLAYVTTYDSIEYKPTKISLSDMLEKRVKFFSTISKVNHKEINTNIQNDIFIYINQIECERIIDNNISNGIKYATKDKLITINLFKNNNLITLEFKTYGNPIKNKDKVFEKNYRENEAKRGLGLGLNMVKGICEKYNITHTVKYEDGQNIFTYIFNVKCKGKMYQ